MSLPNKPLITICPCESGKAYSDCCEAYHLGHPAPTAEALMRSRYTAYVLGLEDYLLQSWHADTRPESLQLAQDVPIQWLGLQVKNHTSNDSKATVAFVARYKVNGKAERMHEISEFELIDGRWYYLTGSVSE